MTSLTKKDIIKQFCGSKKVNIKRESLAFFAPINIALVKYWGKSNFELNLPATPSVSITSTKLGTTTKIVQTNFDKCFLNGVEVLGKTTFYQRIFGFLNLFREVLGIKNCFTIYTSNNFPTASGLASSASGFCALSFAINDIFKLNLDQQQLATIARFGSGSACRSVFCKKCKFVAWENDVVKPVVFEKNDFHNSISMIVLLLADEKKTISSRDGMLLTQQKSKLYQNWIIQTKEDYKNFFEAQDFYTLGLVCENNSLNLHTAIKDTGIDYFNERTYNVVEFTQKQRVQNGLPVFLTIDAGANVCLLFQKQNYQRILATFKSSNLVGENEIVDF